MVIDAILVFVAASLPKIPVATKARRVRWVCRVLEQVGWVLLTIRGSFFASIIESEGPLLLAGLSFPRLHH